MECLICGGALRHDGTDSRVEWAKEQLYCIKCGVWHERLTTYQPQSSLVASDEFYCVDEKGNQVATEEAKCCCNCRFSSDCAADKACEKFELIKEQFP